MLTSYGTSCFVQILDDELAPLENQKQEMQKERIARAEMQKEQLMQHLAACNHLFSMIMIIPVIPYQINKKKLNQMSTVSRMSTMNQISNRN